MSVAIMESLHEESSSDSSSSETHLNIARSEPTFRSSAVTNKHFSEHSYPRGSQQKTRN